MKNILIKNPSTSIITNSIPVKAKIRGFRLPSIKKEKPLDNQNKIKNLNIVNPKNSEDFQEKQRKPQSGNPSIKLFDEAKKYKNVREINTPNLDLINMKLEQEKFDLINNAKYQYFQGKIRKYQEISKNSRSTPKSGYVYEKQYPLYNSNGIIKIAPNKVNVFLSQNISQINNTIKINKHKEKINSCNMYKNIILQPIIPKISNNINIMNRDNYNNINNNSKNYNRNNNLAFYKKIEKNFNKNKNNSSVNSFSINNSNDNLLLKRQLCFISYAYNEFTNIVYRKNMEDYHCIKQTLLKDSTFSYFGIFDGHSGKDVASYLSKNFHKILSTQLEKNYFSDNKISNINSEKIINAINNSFEIADKEIINNQKYSNNVGSTATIILLYKDSNNTRNFICANVGDTKGFLISRNSILQITKDHKCTDAKEVERIKKNGGIVFNGRVFGTLMLTRSFGDKEMKNYGLIVNPSYYEKKISDSDSFIVVASDGVWDVISEDEILKIGQTKISSEKFSRKIVDLAKERDTRDNVSCITIKLNKNI